MKFYKCERCGEIFLVINDAGVVPDCCGAPTELLKTNTVDEVQEKHVPVIERDGKKVTVKVGSVPHPMVPEHHIEWVVLECGKKFQMAYLEPTGEPKAEFLVENADAKLTAYDHCNIHGLWKFEEK